MRKLFLKNKLPYYCIKLIRIAYWKLRLLHWHFIPKNHGKERTNLKFSIGIVTYVDRYNKFFKPLIENLISIFPDTEIVVTVNGYYDKLIQDDYLKDIKTFLRKYQNVKIIDFVDPQSLSKLWNLLILNSSCEKILILNDDLRISTAFRKNLSSSGLLEEEIALINRSWSHFIISKEIIRKVGWFDQRFPGVGNEDEDYECRLVHNNIYIQSYKMNGIENIVFLTSNFSYGKDIATVNKKYIRKNKIFFDSKWEISEMETSSFKYVKILNCYAKIKAGMDTPNFYDLDLLKHQNKIIRQ